MTDAGILVQIVQIQPLEIDLLHDCQIPLDPLSRKEGFENSERRLIYLLVG